MATTDPITGVTIRDQNDFATGGLQLGALLTSLRPFLVVPFTSAAARTTAYANASVAFASGMVSWLTGERRLFIHDGTEHRFIAGVGPDPITWPAGANWDVVSTYARPGYYRDGSGIVHGSGAVRTTAGIAAGATVATLPAGYRPASRLPVQIAATTTSGQVRWDILTSGVVEQQGALASGTVVFLDDFEFNPTTLAAAP